MKDVTFFTFNNYAKIAQLVERHLAKVEVAGSNPVFRSKSTDFICLLLDIINAACRRFFVKDFTNSGSSGGIGRHVGLKIQWTLVRTGSSPVSSTDEKPRLIVLAFSFSACFSLKNFPSHP